jgi:hypothetical protein
MPFLTTVNLAWRSLLPAVAVVALLPALAVAGEKTSSSKADAVPQTQFAKVTNDRHGQARALQVAIVTYTVGVAPNDFSIDLISAIHIGDAAYYQDLNKRFRAYDVLLYELVIPDEPEDPQQLSYGKDFISSTQIGMKNALGLTFQLDEIDYGAANFVHADLTSSMLSQSMADRGESLYVYFWRLFFASMDEYARDPLGLKDWRLLTGLLRSGQDNALKIAIAHEMVDAARNHDILGAEDGSALIAARNEHAVSVLRHQLDNGAKRIGIFYGVAHMHDFEQRLLSSLGATKTKTLWVDAWDFTTDALNTDTQ